jgi:hypothetical protein
MFLTVLSRQAGQVRRPHAVQSQKNPEKLVMRIIRLALLSSLAMTAGLSSAWAQTEPAAAETPAPTQPPPPPTPPTTPAEPASGAAIPGPGAAGQPAPAPEPAPEPAAEEETFPAAWFRIDSDLAGVQLWAGATHMLSESVGIASDIYVLQAGGVSLGEFDIGPSFVAGPMYITPMIGLQVSWTTFEAAALVPQLYITGGPDPIYMELWVQNYEYNVFLDGGPNTLYFRFFIDYKLGKYIGIGPEVEATLGLNDDAKDLFASGETLGSLPVGLNIMLSNYGRNNVLYIFGGYETQDTANDNHLAGRLTFVHNF